MLYTVFLLRPAWCSWWRTYDGCDAFGTAPDGINVWEVCGSYYLSNSLQVQGRCLYCDKESII